MIFLSTKIVLITWIVFSRMSFQSGSWFLFQIFTAQYERSVTPLSSPEFYLRLPPRPLYSLGVAVSRDKTLRPRLVWLLPLQISRYSVFFIRYAWQRIFFCNGTSINSIKKSKRPRAQATSCVELRQTSNRNKMAGTNKEQLNMLRFSLRLSFWCMWSSERSPEGVLQHLRANHEQELHQVKTITRMTIARKIHVV